MSHFPSPYPGPAWQTPPYALPAGQDLLAPARRGGMMLMILSGVGLLCGTCVSLFALAPAELLEQVSSQSPQMQLPPTREVVVSGVMMLAGSITLLVAGLLSRRGTPAGVVTGIVVAALAMLLMLLQFFGIFFAAAQLGLGTAQMLTSACMLVIPTALLALGLAWLIQAARALPRIRQAQAHYAAQWWQYQQNQQTYGVQSPQPPPHPPDEPRF